MFRHSLRAQLVLAFVALSVLPLIAVASILALRSYDVQQRQAIALQREIAERASAQLAGYLESAEGELRQVIQSPDFKSADLTRQRAALLEAIFYKSFFDELALLDDEGREIGRVTRVGMVMPDQLVDRSASPEFRETMARNKTYYGPVSISSLNGEPLLTMAVPVLNASSGQPDGVLVGLARLRQPLERVASIPVGASGSLAVIADGIVIAHRDPQLVAEQRRFSPEISEGVGSGLSGAEVVLSSHRAQLGERELLIVTEIPTSEALQPARETITVAVTLLALAILIALVLGAWLSLQLVRPIRTLASAAQAVGAGDLEQRVAETRGDELGTLQVAFNRMVGSLHEQRAAIEQQNAELQSSIDTTQQLLRTVAELSTPLLPVWDGIVVLPVVGHVDSKRGKEIMETLLRGVAERSAKVAILDITGIAAVDTYVIGLLLQAMRAAALLGARPVIAGISATTAQIIVQQGVDMGTLETYRDLRSAIEAAIRLRDEQRARLAERRKGSGRPLPVVSASGNGHAPAALPSGNGHAPAALPSGNGHGEPFPV